MANHPKSTPYQPGFLFQKASPRVMDYNYMTAQWTPDAFYGGLSIVDGARGYPQNTHYEVGPGYGQKGVRRVPSAYVSGHGMRRSSPNLAARALPILWPSIENTGNYYRNHIAPNNIPYPEPNNYLKHAGGWLDYRNDGGVLGNLGSNPLAVLTAPFTAYATYSAGRTIGTSIRASTTSDQSSDGSAGKAFSIFSTSREVQGTGGYKYKQYKDGSIKIIAGPALVGTTITESSDARRWNAITREIGTWEDYKAGRVTNVAAAVTQAAQAFQPSTSTQRTQQAAAAAAPAAAESGLTAGKVIPYVVLAGSAGFLIYALTRK